MSTNTKGEFVRPDSVFRNWVKADGSTDFAPEANRYHLILSMGCPWANRTFIVRKLKGLEDVIDVSFVNWLMGENGWTFGDDGKEHFGVDTKNHLNDFTILKQFYLSANSSYTGRYTVPVLWDKKKNTMVNNESSEIIRMLNSEFNEFAKNPSLDLYPAPLRAEIDAINEGIYKDVNNGVYRCGFADSQEAYEQACDSLFDRLDKIETVLTKSRYLVGNTFTEADVRLFVSLVRFDPAYYGNFKCNKKQIKEYPALYGYLRDLYNHKGMKECVNFGHIKHGYYSIQKVNPSGIVPKGGMDDLSPDPQRELLG
jgi:putative glutathione S-transferase